MTQSAPLKRVPLHAGIRALHHKLFACVCVWECIYGSLCHSNIFDDSIGCVKENRCQISVFSRPILLCFSNFLLMPPSAQAVNGAVCTLSVPLSTLITDLATHIKWMMDYSRLTLFHLPVLPLWLVQSCAPWGDIYRWHFLSCLIPGYNLG